MVSCPEIICIYECRPRIVDKNTVNKVFQNEGIIFSHTFFEFMFYYQIQETFNFLIRVTACRSMCLTYWPVEAFRSCHITHSKSGCDQIWSDLISNQIPHHFENSFAMGRHTKSKTKACQVYVEISEKWRTHAAELYNQEFKKEPSMGSRA